MSFLNRCPRAITFDVDGTRLQHVSGCERVTDSHEKSIDYQALWPTVGLADWTFPCVDLTNASLARLRLLFKSSVQENVEIESLLVQAIETANWQVKNSGVGEGFVKV